MKVAAALLLASSLCAQTLRETVGRAVKHYPSAQVTVEQMRAAAASIALARTAYLPRADVLAQLNRATRNNIFGLLLPQSTLPSISGPPNPENDQTNVWGSAVGFLVSWEPFDFGLRAANVNAAAAARDRAQAAIARTELEIAAMTADAYLTALASMETKAAAEKQAERARGIEKLVKALVDAELRPGADLSRSRAEFAIAQTRIVQAEHAERVARATLELLTGGSIEVMPLQSVPSLPADLSRNPYVAEQQSAIREAEARRRVLDRTWFPRFMLQASSYARGTGANPDGTTGGALTGIGPNIHNWAAGMTVTFPALEHPALKARKEIETHRIEAEKARLRQIEKETALQLERSMAALAAATRLAGLLPVQLEAARASEQQAAARYQAGLGSLLEVEEAQRLLTQAELDSSLAQLGIWRASLQVAAAQGDLSPLLDKAN